jgi:hypothetical protein
MATALSPAELTSLQALAMATDADIPAEHRAQLMLLGLIVEVLGVIRITSVGRERLKDRERYRRPMTRLKPAAHFP